MAERNPISAAPSPRLVNYRIESVKFTVAREPDAPTKPILSSATGGLTFSSHRQHARISANPSARRGVQGGGGSGGLSHGRGPGSTHNIHSRRASKCDESCS